MLMVSVLGSFSSRHAMGEDGDGEGLKITRAGWTG